MRSVLAWHFLSPTEAESVAAMPYRDPERRRAYMRRYMRRYGDPRNGRATRTVLDGFSRPVDDLDLPKNARKCIVRFFTSNPCRRRAKWIASDGARLCDRHRKGDCRPIEDNK